MAQRVLELINQPGVCQWMGQAAVAYARQAFDIDTAGTDICAMV